jgi:SRSO17 transposase
MRDLLDQDRQPMQRFIGPADRDHCPALMTLAARVGERLGEPDGVIVFDPAAFAKKGDKSVGVARQWCGRLGKVENCQVGVYMGYVCRIEQVLVNFRLFLPDEWTKYRVRCRAAGIPRKVRSQTRPELALEMFTESGSVLPHAWVAGDDAMGRPEWLRRALRGCDERYLLAVPANTRIRDQEAAPPAYSGRGRHPKTPFT